MNDHKCITELERLLNADIEETFAFLFNAITGKQSGYGLRIKIKQTSKTGRITYKHSFVKIAYCPICGEQLDE